MKTRLSDLSRRQLLVRASAASALALFPSFLSTAGCSSSDDAKGSTPSPDASAPVVPASFVHGVASGDPLPDGILLWTRVTPDDPAAPTVTVDWAIAEDAAFTTVVARGNASTGPERDYTVKADVRGLTPGKTYYYRFSAGDRTSPIGRTRTAPTGATARLRFAVVSCSSLAHGYFHAYKAIAARADLDAVIHLGDYIYEYGTGQYGTVRPYEPSHEILNLADYRARHAQYKRDPDLQEAHRQHPFITIWDDHETANDAWKGGAENHDPATEGPWDARKAAAQQAYEEWMPIREPSAGIVYRALAYGDLVDLILLDTRIVGRDHQATGADDPSLTDPSRTLLGATQEAWLADQLRASKATFRIIGQQVMVGQLPQRLNVDAWDGYPAQRTRFFDLLKASKDVVVLTGDIHSSWGMDLTYDPRDPQTYDKDTGRGAVAVEMICPGITSPGLTGDQSSTQALLLQQNAHLKFVDLTRRGYVVLDVQPERAQGSWFLFDDVAQKTATEQFAGALSTRKGTPHLVADDAPIAPPANAPPLAP